jgi:D-alanyl-D-alanine carboxypeptidase
MFRTALVATLLFATPAAAQQLTPAETAKVDTIVADALSSSGVPPPRSRSSATAGSSITKAYGDQGPGMKATERRREIPDRLDLQAVHRRRDPAARGRRQAQPRRQGLEMGARYHRRRPDHASASCSATLPGIQDYWPQDYISPRWKSRSRRSRSSIAGRRSRSISSPAPPGNIRTPAMSSPA